jgi:hypothetical protein
MNIIPALHLEASRSMAWPENFAEDTGELVFEIPESLPPQVWEQAAVQASPAGRWNAYLNRLCLEVLRPQLAAETGQSVRVVPPIRSLPALWEFVNGTALQVGNARWVLLPTEQLDRQELYVPEEWLRIPRWVADHYLGVQVLLDERMVRIWSSATHRQILSTGYREAVDRCYCLADTELVTEPGMLWAQLTSLEMGEARVPVSSLTQPANARTLIERLAVATLPRQELPLDLWLALMEHDGRRQELFDRRAGRPSVWSPLQWLIEGIPTAARDAGWRPTTLAGVARTSATAAPVFLRTLDVAGLACQLTLQRVAAGSWMLQLRPLSPEDLLAPGTVLRILDEDLRGFEGNEDRADEPCSELFVEFGVEPGDGICWEVEPTSGDFTHEILRF